MLKTPFGKINILVDGVAIYYDARSFDYIIEDTEVTKEQMM